MNIESFFVRLTLSRMTVSGPRPLCASLYAIAAPWAPPPQIKTLALDGIELVGSSQVEASTRPLSREKKKVHCNSLLLNSHECIASKFLSLLFFGPFLRAFLLFRRNR